PLSNPENAAENAKKLLMCFGEELSENIYHVQHIASDESLGFFAPDTEGAEIREVVQPQDNETLIVKQFPNSFVNTELHDKLQAQNIEHVVIVGMMTHMCIDATARAAADLGYKVSVVEDARSEEHTSELQSRFDLVCRLLLEKKKKTIKIYPLW